jgi:hypothetical protein
MALDNTIRSQFQQGNIAGLNRCQRDLYIAGLAV